MAQFDVFVNPSTASRDAVPYVVDIQSNFLETLRTRLVMPLSRVAADERGLPRRLVPSFTVEGECLNLYPQEAAALQVRLLKRPVASLAAQAHEIRDALDAVVSGL
jgi:toxin CcdB